MNNDGYILLARTIFTGRFFDSKEPESKKGAYIDLALMANFADREDGTKRGQLLTSYRSLASRWNWSAKRVFTFIKNLEKLGLAKTETRSATPLETPAETLITLVKYDFQRFMETPTETVGETPQEKQKERSKERIKDVLPLCGSTNLLPPQGECESEPEQKQKRFVKPTVEQVAAYCKERNNGIDPQEFVDFYEQSGWKRGKGIPIKDWKACVRTWENMHKKERRSAPAPAKKTAFHNFEERHTDYDALFAEMRKNRGAK